MNQVHHIRVPEFSCNEYRSLGYQRHLFNFLQKGGQEALRLRVESRSRASGTMPRWLKDASEIEFLGYGDAPGDLTFQAPALGPIMQSDDRSPLFAPSWLPTQSVLELLEGSIEDALSTSPDSEWLDDGLLDTIDTELRPIFRRFSSIEWRNGREVKMNRESLLSFSALRQKTPSTQECRIYGKLEAIRHSDHAFALVLEDKHIIRGVAMPDLDEKLKRQWGTMVVVHGEAVFRPSKSLLRVEARDIEPAQPKDAVFSYIPQPLFSENEIGNFSESQAKDGIRSIFGKWPGTETEEEIIAGLRKMR